MKSENYSKVLNKWTINKFFQQKSLYLNILTTNQSKHTQIEILIVEFPSATELWVMM